MLDNAPALRRGIVEPTVSNLEPDMGFELTNVKENSIYALGTLKDSGVLTAKQFFPLFIGWFLSQALPVVLIGILSGSGFLIDKFILHCAKFGPFTVFGLLTGAAALGSFWAGWAKINLKVVRGISVKAGDVICSPNQIVAGLIACVITSILIGMGWWLIVPGFLLAIKWQLTPYFIVDKNCGPIEAMKQSWHATEDRIFIPMAALSLMFLGIGALSSSIIIGPVLVFMAQSVASAYIYCRWLTDEEAPFNRADLLEDHHEVAK